MMTKEEFRVALYRRLPGRNLPDPSIMNVIAEVYAESVERETADRADFTAAVMEEASKTVDQLTAEIATLKAEHEARVVDLERARALVQQEYHTIVEAVEDLREELAVQIAARGCAVSQRNQAQGERDEARAEVERLKFQRDAAIEHNGSVQGELERAKKWAVDALDEVARLKAELLDALDVAGLLGASKADAEAEISRLKGERDELAGMEEERTNELQSAVSDLERVTKERDSVLRATATYNVNRMQTENVRLLERLALADKLADAASAWDDPPAAKLATYTVFRLALDAYRLASREGAGEKEPGADRCAGCGERIDAHGKDAECPEPADPPEGLAEEIAEAAQPSEDPGQVPAPPKPYATIHEVKVSPEVYATSTAEELASPAKCPDLAPIPPHEPTRVLAEAALRAVKLRIHFIGWPNEAYWEASPQRWISDWRKEIALIEAALAAFDREWVRGEGRLAKLEEFRRVVGPLVPLAHYRDSPGECCFGCSLREGQLVPWPCPVIAALEAAEPGRQG